ncbi:MAG: hypothetical protein A2Z14_17040, partial [Chloroflexi bacterium RBG_16_48_8]
MDTGAGVCQHRVNTLEKNQNVSHNIQRLYIMRHRMNISMLTSFASIPYFTIEGFRQVAGIEESNDPHTRIALYRWTKAGHVIRLKKGVYMTRQFYEIHRGDLSFSSAMSAILQPQSYISLETILQRHGILTEATYPVTAITAKHTRLIENKLGTFIYRHVRSSLYRGFIIADYYGVPFAEASLPKALFDYLYLRPLAVVSRVARFNLAEELRLNLDEFSAQ